MNTILTNKYPISEQKFFRFVKINLKPLVGKLNSTINELDEDIKLLLKKDEAFQLNDNIFFGQKNKLLSELKSNQIKWENFFRNPQIILRELKNKLHEKNNNEEDNNENIYCLYNNETYIEISYDSQKKELKENNKKDNKETKINIPYNNQDNFEISSAFSFYLLFKNLCPQELPEEKKCLFRDLAELYAKNQDIITNQGTDKLAFNGDLFLSILKTENKEWLNQLSIIRHWINIYESEQFKGKEISELVKNKLLNCEKIRADIDPYEEKILSDPNRGHWDLWYEPTALYSEISKDVDKDKGFYARDPRNDINYNGVIGIDFGTKSTVVVYQKDIDFSLPMGIGDGNLKKEPTPKRYENPTVMHFVDLDSFLKSYKAKKGRPDTEWEHLTISHTAMEQFSKSSSEEYYDYLRQIKQWASQREKEFRISFNNGETKILPAFLDLTEDDWNPIEIYAYYIGLFINNMRNGIYLDYYLSFPVTYEAKIREKILKSFELGLKKSLPSVILNDEGIMKRFKINGDISEPAAYAVCALQEYGFDPCGNEEIFYGIFDFGGGTTDFDFGLWKNSSKSNYDYSIENFGAGGDKYLGGENLLEMLAFEVFKDNQKLMREKEFTFTLAPKCNEFLGSDGLLANSQESEKNMHNLMEKIRPYWENQTEDINNEQIENNLNNSEINTEISEDKNNDNIEFTLTLFDKKGVDHPNEKLTFSLKKLNDIIQNRIREGVNNFFSALMLSYQNDKGKKPTKVNIFLAGNSCKSDIVYKEFEKAIIEQEKAIQEKYPNEKITDNLFEIFPPLGTEKAYKKMEERGIKPDRNNFEKPTGKTGVAFGLIECREGGAIERITKLGISDEIPFQYFIGWGKKKKFVIFKDENKTTPLLGKPDYNQWYIFTKASSPTFELFYTTLPECVEGNLPVNGNPAVKRLRCKIDKFDDNLFVYIRAIDPHTLEYAVATAPDKIDEKEIIRETLR